MKRKISAVLIVVSMLLLTCTAMAIDYGEELSPNEKTYSQTFSDVTPNHWAFQYVEELVERKAINGYPDGKFYPDNIVTRQEFAKIMLVAAGLTPAPASKSSYTDVPLTHWASPFIETAKPYMTAYQNTMGQLSFQPSAGALREDIAVAVVKLKGYDTRLADLSLLDTMFSDVSAISTSTKPYIALSVESGIISGYVDGTFRGQNTITRAEAAAILWRAFQYGNDQKVIPGENATAPTPTLTPNPTSSPKPEQPRSDAKKPYIADTLVKAKITDANLLMTMDSDSNLIYYDADLKKILKLSPSTGKVVTLLDVANATCTMADTSKDGDSIQTTYSDLSVKQMFWDNVGTQLLIEGCFDNVKVKNDHGWVSPSTGKSSFHAFFTLGNNTLNYFSNMPQDLVDEKSWHQHIYKKILCSLDNDMFILGSDVNGYSYYSMFIYDLKNDKTNSCLSNDDQYRIRIAVQKGQDIFRVIAGGSIQQYDYGTGSWTYVSDIANDEAIAYQNQCFYTFWYKSIEATRLNGQKKILLNPSTDITILDLLPIPNYPNNLFVTKNECFLFYDSFAQVIRMISANPEY